jgi:hypothetical protein
MAGFLVKKRLPTPFPVVDLFRKAVAAAFLAREESLARTPQAQSAYAEAVDAVKAVSLKSLAAVLSTVLGKVKSSLNDRDKR